jgi:hypothetical protein
LSAISLRRVASLAGLSRAVSLNTQTRVTMSRALTWFVYWCNVSMLVIMVMVTVTVIIIVVGSHPRVLIRKDPISIR